MRKILLAVSGGADSTYLALKSREFFPGAELAVAHCNFRLRGEESDGDESFVAELSRRLGLPFFSVSFDTRSVAASRGVSIEMAARELRYEWFAQRCREDGFDAVAVAHNASDNVETLLLNMLRGTGTCGMRGMSADSVCEYGCRILRPMLCTSREEITEFLDRAGQPWREDRTNSENGHRRNRLRNLVLPVFKGINPSYLTTLRSDMKHISQVDDIADEFYRRVRSESLLPDGSLDLDVVRKAGHTEYLLWRLTADLASRAGVGTLSEDQLGGLLGAVTAGGPSSGKRFGDFVISKGKLMVLPSAAPVVADSFSVSEIPASELPSPKAPAGVLLLDRDKLAGGFRTRPWQPGDWMRPLGMRGRKKLSDMFVDLGWDERQKSSATVVELDGSHVAALLPVRIDESVKVTASTKTVLRIGRKE